MRYEDTLSADQEEIEKTFWCKWDKSVYLKGETTMIYVYDRRIMPWTNVNIHLKTFPG